MLGPQELHGVLAMMPAFATDDGASLIARNTVDVDELARAVDRIIEDGVDAIATTGSFGEFHTLLDGEFETLTRATIEAAKHRVPVLIGVTALHTRAVLDKMEIARDAGADGVLVGVPGYFPATVANAIEFYRGIAELFPSLAIMIYHNPDLHRVHLPVDAFRTIAKIPNIVAMKDSHRTTRGFIELMEIVGDRLSVFVHPRQYVPYASLGAAGMWSIDCWMGPWPVLYLRDAVARGDDAGAREALLEISNVVEGEAPQLHWRETAAKVAVGYAGYCRPGPLRPPFVIVPPEVDERARARAEAWRRLCDKYQGRMATARAPSQAALAAQARVPS